MKKLKKIPSSDVCNYCGHKAEDGEFDSVRIYDTRRAKWLEEAARQLVGMDGDDDWVDWIDEDKELRKAGV